MAANIPLRHELKFFISEMQYHILSRQLDHVLARDPNGDENNEYHIRSLYFDTVFNDAYFDKIDGVRDRNKYRIRIYNLSDRVIKLECKTKVGSLISKRSLSIPRDLCDQIIACDPEGLEKTPYGLLSDVYREMTCGLLRPVVLVDYDRTVFVHPLGNTRITLDRFVRSAPYKTELFDPALCTLPVLPEGQCVLEVKYDKIIPAFLPRMLEGIPKDRSSVSKYCRCLSIGE